jgi:hypothetical protein
MVSIDTKACSSAAVTFAPLAKPLRSVQQEVSKPQKPIFLFPGNKKIKKIATTGGKKKSETK